MWARDYLRVLRREITFWEAKGAPGTTFFVILRARHSDFGWTVFEASAWDVGGDPIVYLRFYWWDEFRALPMGAAVA